MAALQAGALSAIPLEKEQSMTDTGSQRASDAASCTKEPLAVRVGAELAGSFIVFFAIYSFTTFGTALFGINMAFIALATGIAYAAVTLVFSKVSGGQLNPAITLAAILTGKTKVLDGILYIIAQVLGGIAAGALIVRILPTTETLTAKIWLTDAVNGFGNGSVSASTLSSVSASFDITLAVVVEIIASIVVIAAALATMNKETTAVSHAAAIGFAYGLGAAMTYPVTGAGMNPARSTGIALFARNAGLSQNPLQQLWVFWICPILAAAIVAMVMIGAQLLRDNANAKQQVVDDTAAQQNVADTDALALSGNDATQTATESADHSEQEASAVSEHDADAQIEQ